MKILLSYYFWWLSLSAILIILNIVFDKLQIFEAKDSDTIIAFTGILIIMNIGCKVMSTLERIIRK